jgi:uncharacterized membrane protein YfcA
MHLAYLPIAVLIVVFVYRKIQAEYRYRIAISFPFDKNDLVWTNRTFLLFPVYGFFIGIIAGLMGVGGGLFIAPLLLVLGMNPISATTTSNFLMLFTASSTTIQFSLHVFIYKSLGLNEFSI